MVDPKITSSRSNYELRKIIYNMEKKLEKYKKQSKKIKDIKKNYNDLLDCYEKSEQLCKAQKDVINTLRAENAKLKKTIKNANDGEERAKSKSKRKVVKDQAKASSRRKSKKARKIR